MWTPAPAVPWVPCGPHVRTRWGAHLHVLQSQVLPAAPSVNRKPRARTRHQAKDAHECLDRWVDAETDVVARRRMGGHADSDRNTQGMERATFKGTVQQH